MPIWPTTTKAKAALFNKYGRGIIHMGLHEGVDEFIYDMGGRRRRGRPRKHVNVLEINMNLDSIEAAIDIMPVKMVARSVVGPPYEPTYFFDGTGTDWRLLPNMIIDGDFGPAVMVDAKLRIGIVDSTVWYQFAIAIDEVIDMSSAIRYQGALGTNAWHPEIKTVLYPGPGQHKFQLAFVVEYFVEAWVYEEMAVMRLIGLLETERV